jgi:flagellar FliL protein
MADEQTTPAEGEEQPQPTRGKLPLILSILVGLVVGGASGALALGPMVAKKVAPPVTTADVAAAAAPRKADGKEAKKPAIHVIDNLVLNPAESGGGRFLLLTVAFQMKDDATLAEIKGRDEEVRDAVLRVLGAKTVDELADVKRREGFRIELKTAIGGMFEEKDAVSRIYFPQFVIQ